LEFCQSFVYFLFLLCHKVEHDKPNPKYQEDFLILDILHPDIMGYHHLFPIVAVVCVLGGLLELLVLFV
jgi:hypothetical protein